MVSSITHQRSASYPPKTNSIVQKIEEELKKLRKSESTSTSITEKICIGLKGLFKLYKFVDDMLNMPLLSQRSTTLSLNLSKHGHFLIEGSSKLLEICASLKQILEKFLVECSSSNELKISSYCSLRKEMIKSAKSLALQLRQVEGSFVSRNEVISNEGYFDVIRVLKCVSIINISVVESLLRFLGMPLKSRRFGLFSKLVMIKKSKNVISEEDLPKCGNELSNVDLVVVLHSFDVERFEDNEFVKKRLEVLEVALRGIDDGLSNIVKQLSKTRASLMSIISA